MRRLIFYTTTGCHLCEQALAMLEPLVEQCQISIDLIDIATDEALTAEYGIRIPVVRNPADGAELKWPFSRDDVLNISMATE